MRNVPVQLKFDRYPDVVVEGTAVVVDRSPGARIGRAFLGLAIVWFFMFLGVFVPGFHFVIVPTLFVVGIVVFAMRLREHHSLVEVRGKCPRCKDEVERSYPESGTFKDGRKSRCSQCAESFRLVVRKELPAG